jgi:protoporphyrinogen oxidase
MTQKQIVVLGAGPAGVAAAYKLAGRGVGAVTLLERNKAVGGNAGSFELAGMRVDYGSHRLHPGADPAVLEDIRALIGTDLLERRRHGRIRLRGRWIRFPLRATDLVRHLPPSFALGSAADLLGCGAGRLRRGTPAGESFGEVLEAGLGRTICRDFYFPYARKIWGLDPSELSAIQARKRVATYSPGRLLRRLVPLRSRGPSYGATFLYPRQGYGQISETFATQAVARGARLWLGAEVSALETCNGAVKTVATRKDGREERLPADLVLSTLPMNLLAQRIHPAPPPELLRATQQLDFRAMVLIYLVLDQDRFSEYDAHYFPELGIPISRLSEPKNFNDGNGPVGRTVICAELPCSPDGPELGLTDEALGELLCESLEAAEIPVRSPVLQIATRRLRHAYPLYRRGYETHFDQLDGWLRQIDGLISFGRQGLFSHDNADQAMQMAYSAVDCVDHDARFNRERWAEYRRVFESYVVQD